MKTSTASMVMLAGLLLPFLFLPVASQLPDYSSVPLAEYPVASMNLFEGDSDRVTSGAADAPPNAVELHPQVTSIYMGASLTVNLTNTYQADAKSRGVIVKVPSVLSVMWANGTAIGGSQVFDPVEGELNVYTFNETLLSPGQTRVIGLYIDSTYLQTTRVLAISHKATIIPTLAGNQQETIEKFFILYKENSILITDETHRMGNSLTYQIKSWVSPAMDSIFEFTLQNPNALPKEYTFIANIPKEAPISFKGIDAVDDGECWQYTLINRELAPGASHAGAVEIEYNGQVSQNLTFVRYSVKCTFGVNGAESNLSKSFIDVYRNNENMLGALLSEVQEENVVFLTSDGNHIMIRFKTPQSGLDLRVRPNNGLFALPMAEISPGVYVLKTDYTSFAEKWGVPWLGTGLKVSYEIVSMLKIDMRLTLILGAASYLMNQVDVDGPDVMSIVISVITIVGLVCVCIVCCSSGS
jgi:hypothetical protein